MVVHDRAKTKRQRAAASSSSHSEGSSENRQLANQLCTLALVAVSPAVGCNTEVWRNVFFAVLNSLGDNHLAVEVFNQWTSAADNYTGIDNIQQIFRLECKRIGKHNFDISFLFEWASSSPALTLSQCESNNTEAHKLTAATLLARCNFKKSSWQFVVLASSHLFAGEKETVVAAVCKHLCSVGWGSEQALRSVEAVWAQPAGTSEHYTEALRQYVVAKLMDVDFLFSQLFPGTAHWQLGRVYASYLVSLEEGKESVVFWASCRVSSASVHNDQCSTGELELAAMEVDSNEPQGELGNLNERMRECKSAAKDSSLSHIFQPLSVHLQSMRVRHCLSGEEVEGVFPLQWFFTQPESNSMSGPVSLVKFFAECIAPFSPICFDTSEKEWRHFRSDLGLWALPKSVDLAPQTEKMRCTCPIILFSDCVRSLAQPLLGTARFLAKFNKSKKDQEEQKKLSRFVGQYCESPQIISVVLKSLAACSTMSSSFDKQPPHLLCCPNGIVDLRRGSLIPPLQLTANICAWARALELTEEQFCATPFVPSKTPSMMKAFFLHHLLPPDVYSEDAEKILSALQMFLGYRLTGETNVHQAWLLVGEGGNMKSLLSKWLFETLGPDFVAMLAAKDLNSKSSDNNDALFKARRKRAWNINESGTRNQWDEEMFKGITGGECQRGISAKYKSEATFKPVAKLMAFVNELPQWNSPDAFALHRRCVVLHLHVCYAANKEERENLLERDIKPEWIREANPNFYNEKMAPYKQQFLVWLVEGAKRFYDSSHAIPIPRSLCGQRAFNQQQDTPKRVDEFLWCRLKYKSGHRLPLAWMHEAVLGELEMAKSKLSMKKFGEVCRNVLKCRFPNAKWNSKTKVTLVNHSKSTVIPCFMDVYWTEDALEEMQSTGWHIRENENAMPRQP